MSNATKFSSYEFSGLDELLAVADKLPVAETKSLAKLPRAAETWRNAGDYKAVFSGERLWQISGKTYTVVQHAALIKAVVCQLAQLGLDDSHGRVDAWNEGGRIWITALSPHEFQPLPGDTYRDGVIFGNSSMPVARSRLPTTHGVKSARTDSMHGLVNWPPAKYTQEPVASSAG